jgi:hypothetical protein
MIDLDRIRSLAIIGNLDQGKTNLLFYYGNSYKGTRKKYLFGYPKEMEGYTSLYSWEDLLKIRDGIILIDEINTFIKIYDKKKNYQLMELISLFAHKNNTLIFTTQLSQFINRGVEAFIDCWAIKRLDLETLKNGSKPKRIIQRLNYPKKNEWVLDLEQNEFYEFSDKNGIGENRVKTFPFQEVGKDW